LANDPLQVLEQCVLLGEPVTTTLQGSLEIAKNGYLAYNEAVHHVLAARRQGRGIEFQPDAPTLAALAEYANQLRGLLGSLPPGFGRYFRHIPALPYKLLWAFLLLRTPGASSDWCLPLVRHVATRAVERQRDLLQSAIQAAAQAREQHLRLTMLEKIYERPGKRRDLYRRYTVQRKELHLPLLCQLFAEGLVTERPDGILEISSAGQAQLTGARARTGPP
jgi:hypothetical protein